MIGVIEKDQLLNKRIWYCDVREKEMNFSSRLRHIKSKTHIHKKEYGILVKEYEIIKPETDEVDDILDNVIEDYKDKFFSYI